MIYPGQFLVSDYFWQFGGDLEGVQDCTNAIRQCCATAEAYAQAHSNQGVEIVFPAGEMKVLDPSSGNNSLWGFAAGLKGIHLRNLGCKFVVSSAFPHSPYTNAYRLFAFTDCEDVVVDEWVVSAPAVNTTGADGFKGVAFCYFIGKCRNVSALGGDFTGVSTTFLIPAETGTGRARDFRFGVVRATNCIYGIAGQDNGDDVHIELLDCDDTFRPFVIYGVRHWDIRCKTKNSRGRAEMNGTSGGIGDVPTGCEDIRILYDDRESTACTSDVRLVSHMGVTPCAFKRISITFLIDYIASAGTGSGGPPLLIEKVNGTTPDPIDRGHELSGWTIAGLITGTPGTNGWTDSPAIFMDPAARWGTGEIIRNFCIDGLQLQGAGAIDLQMDPLKDVAVLKNVVSDAVVRLRKAASIDTTLSGNIVVDGCSFPNLDVDVTGPPAGKALTVGRLKMITPTLLNSWANYDPSTYAPAAFTKTADGVVHIEGLVKDGTSDLVFILPVGYRPPTNTQFAQIANSAFARLEVQSDGHVRAYGSNANHWLTATFRV